MGVEPELERVLEAVVRALSTATRSLRLYPPTSPIPRQTIDSATVALAEFFGSGASDLTLAVAREGFAFEGQPVASYVAGGLEFANTLRDHGIAQMTIAPDVSADDLINLLLVVSRPPVEVRAEGGIAKAATALGVQHVLLTDVQLVVMDGASAGDVNPETRLRDIATSPVQLGTWFTWASGSGREVLRGNLDDLVAVAGETGKENLADGISETYTQQPIDNTDALLSLALEPGHARDVTRRVFGQVPAEDIATSIIGGVFGRNMLSLSSALTNLPFEQADPSVQGRVRNLLPSTGAGPDDEQFLDHMVDVRTSPEPEPALIESDETYKAVVSVGSLNEADVTRVREATGAAANVLEAVGANTLFALLDSQTDFHRYCSNIDSIAAIVPRLLDAGDLQLASHLIDELAARESRHPEWPALPAHLAAALSSAVQPGSAEAIVSALVSDRTLVPVAKRILRFSDEPVNVAIAQRALMHKSEGLAVGEALLGRRLVELLNQLAPHAQWFQLGPVVVRLAQAGDQRSLATIGGLLARPDEQSRRKVVGALADTTVSPGTLALLGTALRDPNEDVATLAAREIAKSGVRGSAALLGARLNELDMDNGDFTLARELIGAVARTPEPTADEVLVRLSSRRAFIKKGHFIEVQNIVAQAIEMRQGGRVPR